MEKTKKVIYLFLVTFLMIIYTSCSGDDDNDNGTNQIICLKDDFQLTETKVTDISGTNSVIVTFDVKNNSSTNFSVKDGSTPINNTIVVTTEDGTTFETSNLFNVSSLSSGSTTSVDVLGNYGAGKIYSSYTISLSCQ